MSGGHFNYTQYQLTQIADDIEQLIVDNDNEEKNEWGDVTGRHYTAETIAEFQTAVDMLRQSYTYVQRVDWLVSGDDSEQDFHTRLRKELKEKHMSSNPVSVEAADCWSNEAIRAWHAVQAKSKEKNT
jgi:hypothetical protein